jgi:hypothetical protein
MFRLVDQYDALVGWGSRVGLLTCLGIELATTTRPYLFKALKVLKVLMLMA